MDHICAGGSRESSFGLPPKRIRIGVLGQCFPAQRRGKVDDAMDLSGGVGRVVRDAAEVEVGERMSGLPAGTQTRKTCCCDPHLLTLGLSVNRRLFEKLYQKYSIL